MNEFNKAIARICEELKPLVERQAQLSGRTLVSCFMSMLRPHILYALDPTLVEGKSSAPDTRAKTWSIEVTFWDVSQGRKNADLLAECAEEVVLGMDGVLLAIQGDVIAMHEGKVKRASDIPEFSDLSLKRRLGGLRPAISRGGGSATLRVYYSVGLSDRLLCAIRVARIKK